MSVKKNIKINLVGAVVPVIFAFPSVPYLVENMGSENFGVLVLIWALIGYFSFFDFGIGRALTYKLSKIKLVNLNEVESIVWTGLGLALLMGILGGVLFLCMLGMDIIKYFRIPSNIKDDALIAFVIASFGITVTTLNNGVKGVLEGLNRFYESNLNKMLVGTFMFIGPLISVKFFGPQIWTCSLFIVVSRIFILFYSLSHLKIKIRINFEIKLVKELIFYGGWLTVTGVVGPVMIYGDRFFVSASMGAENLHYYAIPQEALQRLLIIPAAISSALLPHLSSLLNFDRFNEDYRLYLKKTSLIMLLVCSVTGLVSYHFFSLWISVDFADKTYLMILIIILGIYFNSLALMPYTALHALGLPKITAIYHVFELFIYTFAIIILTERFGLVGAALAWTGRVIFDFLLLHITVLNLNKVLK